MTDLVCTFLCFDYLLACLSDCIDQKGLVLDMISGHRCQTMRVARDRYECWFGLGMGGPCNAMELANLLCSSCFKTGSLLELLYSFC